MIDSHVIELGAWSGTRRNVTIKFYDGAQEVWSMEFFGPPENFDDAFAISLYPNVTGYLGDQEVEIAMNLIDQYQNPDTLTTYLDQADFDRRVLGHIMTLEDCHKLNACLPYWQAVQSRHGANDAARAAALGVPLADYDLVAARFNDYFGVSTFLIDDKAAIWSDPGVFV